MSNINKYNAFTKHMYTHIDSSDKKPAQIFNLKVRPAESSELLYFISVIFDLQACESEISISSALVIRRSILGSGLFYCCKNFLFNI